MTLEDIVNHICNKIEAHQKEATLSYNSSKANIGFFYIDDLLPETIARACFEFFPDKSEMRCLKSIREYKYVSAQMDKHNPLLEKVLYAFQNEKVVSLMSEICGINILHADDTLYAGGLSLMAGQNFLNPHLDNSHDAERERWRVLNLLFYVTPNWKLENGGHLEIWPNGPKKKPVLIES